MKTRAGFSALPHSRRHHCSLAVNTNDHFRHAHMLVHKYQRRTQTHTELDNKPTNCPSVYFVMSGFIHCKRGNGSDQPAGQKATEVREVGSWSCVLLIMGRRVLAFNLVDQGHGNRCEGGNRLGGGGSSRELGLRLIWSQRNAAKIRIRRQ